MKSRRLIALPEAKDKQSYRFTSAAMHKIAVKYQWLAFYGHSRQTSKSSDAKSRETMANADKNRASKAERHLDPVHDDVSVQKLEYSGLGRGCTAPITDSCRGNRVAMVVEPDRKYGRRGQRCRP